MLITIKVSGHGRQYAMDGILANDGWQNMFHVRHHVFVRLQARIANK